MGLRMVGLPPPFAPLVSEDVVVLLSKLVDKFLVAAEAGGRTATYRLLENNARIRAAASC